MRVERRARYATNAILIYFMYTCIRRFRIMCNVFVKNKFRRLRTRKSLSFI